MRFRSTIRSSLAATIAWAAVVVALPASAASLYTFDVGGGLYRVNPATGATTQIGAALPYGFRDMSSRPGDGDHVFAVRTDLLPSDPATLVARIDVHTATSEALYSLSAADLGYDPNFAFGATGIAISPLDGSTAAIAGLLTRPDPSSPADFVWVAFAIDLESGALSTPVYEYPSDEGLAALTWSLDGSTLYTTIHAASEHALATVDLATGVVSEIGKTGITLATGLAFDPASGELYGIDAYTTDALARFSPTTGAVLETIGWTGLGAPSGLAFVPEPGTGLLLPGALLAAGGSGRSRRRPHSSLRSS